MIECIICRNRNVQTIDLDIDHLGVMERHITCDRCGYEYHYAYGEYWEVIAGRVFRYEWHDFSEDNPEGQRKLQEADALKKQEARKWAA